MSSFYISAKFSEVTKIRNLLCEHDVGMCKLKLFGGLLLLTKLCPNLYMAQGYAEYFKATSHPPPGAANLGR